MYAPWPEVRDIEVDGTSATTTTGPDMNAVLAFGVAGLASGHKSRTTTSTTIVARTTRGTISFVVTTVNTPAHIVRAQLALYRPADFGSQAAPDPAAPATEVRVLLRQVAQAHEEGLLTDAEYAAKREEIIRRI